MDIQRAGGRLPPGSRISDGATSAQLATGLGLFSLGLGLAEITVPRALARIIGVVPDGPTRGTLRAIGAREIAHGVGILARPRNPMPVWSRVAGDVIDLAFLAWSTRARRTSGQRLAGAFFAVLGVAALDVYAGQRLRRERAARGPAGARPSTRHAQVTINRPHDEVKARWRELAGDLPNIHDVVFTRAPGGRGTEVSVTYKAPSLLRRMMGRLLHTDVEQLADGDLRKIKQLIELGEIVHSDASIHRGMHSAQPPRLSSGKEL